MNEERIRFENSTGHELAGVLHLPKGRPAAWVLFAHCFTCTKNIKAAVHISQALVDHGFAVLRFDFTGLGESEGEFEDTTFSSSVEDLVSAAAFLEREYEAPAVFVGHSLGGAAVMRAAHRVKSVRAVATIAAPADPGHVRRLLRDSEETIRQQGTAQVDLSGRTFSIGKEFLDDLERSDWRDVIHNLRRPLLVFHSPVDNTVSIENAQLIYENALHPKSFVSLEDADHLLSKAVDSRYVAAVLAAWASRYLDVQEKTELAEDDNVDGVVATIGRERFRTEVRGDRHVLVADEPVRVGGTDLGFSPYDLLGAALATCTAMTLRLYADHKSWDLAEASVRVRHDRVHETDCEHCEEDGHRIDRLRRDVAISGNLDETQRARLMEIADRCPVHKTLSSKLLIETREQKQESSVE